MRRGRKRVRGGHVDKNEEKGSVRGDKVRQEVEERRQKSREKEVHIQKRNVRK